MKTTAALTAMDTPIGMTIGNSLEVIEAVEALRGQGPADLIELVTVEGGLILQSMGRVEDLQQGIQQVDGCCAPASFVVSKDCMLH